MDREWCHVFWTFVFLWPQIYFSKAYKLLSLFTLSSSVIIMCLCLHYSPRRQSQYNYTTVFATHKWTMQFLFVLFMIVKCYKVVQITLAIITVQISCLIYTLTVMLVSRVDHCQTIAQSQYTSGYQCSKHNPTKILRCNLCVPGTSRTEMSTLLFTQINVEWNPTLGTGQKWPKWRGDPNRESNFLSFTVFRLYLGLYWGSTVLKLEKSTLYTGFHWVY